MTALLRFSLIVVLFLGFSSCEKGEGGGPDNKTRYLTKVNSWDPVTGAEGNLIEVLYNENKDITSVHIAPYTYSLEHNAAGKLIRAVGLDASGNQMTYQADYNSTGQLIKNTVRSKPAGQTDETIIRFDGFEYNSEGKVIRISTFAPDGLTITQISEYTWTGNNIQECSVGEGPTPQVRKANTIITSAMGYDDKVNPMTRIGVLPELVYSREFSRNNPTQMKIKEGTAIDFIAEAFPIYEYKAGAVVGVKYNLHEGNSLIHITIPGNKGLKFGYE